MSFIPLKDYEGIYEIATCGKINSVPRNGTRGGIIGNYIGSTGHVEVCLRANGKQKVKKVHRLVAEHFVDNPDNLPCVKHIDGDRLNNCASNLKWAGRGNG